MRAIKTRPRFHCDFCSRTSTEKAMERHERICWLNPNRHCVNCNDTGWQDEGDPCYWCSKLDQEILLTAWGPGTMIERKFGLDYL